MKKIFYLLILIPGTATTSFSQSTSINSDGSTPNSNTMLGIIASDKGLLIPRTSTTTHLNISHTKGLWVDSLTGEKINSIKN